MIKHICLATMLLSFSLHAVPKFIKVLESPAKNSTVSNLWFGKIEDNTLWLAVDSECMIGKRTFREFINQQHAREKPFIVAVTQVIKNEQCSYQIYEANSLNTGRYGKNYAGYLPFMLKAQVEMLQKKDFYTSQLSVREDYYMLVPNAESFLYVGNVDKFLKLKGLFWYAFEDNVDNIEMTLSAADRAYDGEGIIAQSYEKAFQLYKKAANWGDINAMFNIAVMYYRGEGVAEDKQAAEAWYNKAAEFEHAGAMNNLGSMYYEGDGVEQDYQKAWKWHNEAAKLGNKDAQYNLKTMYQSKMDRND